ncbi:MAG: XrtA/PEP-CTERM system TPR-repeat protein PrsT [Massilia sp.]
MGNARSHRSRAYTFVLACVLSLGACHSEPGPEALMRQARQYRDAGDLRAAVIQLKNVLQQNANNREARQLLGEVYLDQADAVSAEKEFRRAIALGAGAIDLAPLLGRSLLMQAHFDQLLDNVNVPLDVSRLPAILALRGNAMMGLLQPREAAAAFEQALSLDPHHPAALLGMARLAAAHGQAAQAHALLQRALAGHPDDIDCLRFQADLRKLAGQPEAALSGYQHVLTLKPRHVQTYIDIANLYIDSGKFGEARAALQRARSQSAVTLPLLFAQALLNYREHKYGAATETLQAILRIAPDYHPAVLLLATIEASNGADQLAEQHAEQFLRAFPLHPFASKLLAMLQLRADHFDAALVTVLPVLAAHPDDLDLLTLAGETHMRARQFDRAARYFEKASSLRPASASLHAALGLSRLAQGDHGRAIAELERSAALDIAAPRAGVLLVMSHLRAGAPDKALAVITRMQQQAPSALLHNLKGGVLLAMHNPRAARPSFVAALQCDALYLPALDNLAQLDVMEGDADAGARRYLTALEKSPRNTALMEALARHYTSQGRATDATALLEKALAVQPDSLRLGLRLADFYSRSGQQQRARDLARKLVASNPGNADALAMLARVAQAGGDHVSAAEQYGKLVAVMPGATEPLFQLAEQQHAMRDDVAAMRSLRKVLQIAPERADAQILLLATLCAQKKYDDALAFARAVQRQQPASPRGHRLEAELYAVQGNNAAALRVVQHAFTRWPSSDLLIQTHSLLLANGLPRQAQARMDGWLASHPQDVQARLVDASLKQRNNDVTGAIAQLEYILAQNPNHVAALNDLAWCYLRTRQGKARSYAERAWRLAPDSPAVMDTLGWLLHTDGERKRALTLLKQARSAAPANAAIGYHLAVALATSGDKRAARGELERVLAMPSDFDGKDEARVLLATL